MNKIYTKELLEPMVASSSSFSDVLRLLRPGRTVHGGSIDWLKKKLIELEIDYSHFTGRAWMLGRSCISGRKLSMVGLCDKYLVDGSVINTQKLKRYILRYGLLDYVCKLCGNEGVWLGRELTLQIDHINGIRSDNRLENLRFICPNCHSQTDTYAGKKNNGSNSLEKTAL